MNSFLLPRPDLGAEKACYFSFYMKSEDMEMEFSCFCNEKKRLSAFHSSE